MPTGLPKFHTHSDIHLFELILPSPQTRQAEICTQNQGTGSGRRQSLMLKPPGDPERVPKSSDGLVTTLMIIYGYQGLNPAYRLRVRKS
ncbi:Hypothetical predicted protein [Pelobates cultripes]|uniref:Uncharacterized protein n=1 Tax=Pelobates cultripes TaxID=61616 RepID=A0AAD1R6U3_PELCU|nr:Hypothetical predicted protein [Pelobates cultripes]